VSLLTYTNTDPKQALPLLAKIMRETLSHTPYATPNVLPSADPTRKERREADLLIKVCERKISVLCPSFGDGARSATDVPDVQSIELGD
jgi:hypothetical protein